MRITAILARGGALIVCIVLSLIAFAIAQPDDPPLLVLKTGLGSGTVTGTGINCGIDCDESFASTDKVTLTATAPAGSTFTGWGGDCSGTGICTVSMNVPRAVTANFTWDTSITTITDFTPTGLQTYLTAHPEINTPARFIAALPAEFKQNWILMSRSESLQTGTAARLASCCPAATRASRSPSGWRRTAPIPARIPTRSSTCSGTPPRRTSASTRSCSTTSRQCRRRARFRRDTRRVDRRRKCFECHSTRNVLNRSDLQAPPASAGRREGEEQAELGRLRQLGRHDAVQPRPHLPGLGGGSGVPQALQSLDLAQQRGERQHRQILEQLQLQSSAPAGRRTRSRASSAARPIRPHRLRVRRAARDLRRPRSRCVQLRRSESTSASTVTQGGDT